MITINDQLVSIILPIRNERVRICSALDAIFAQDYPQEKIEILAADGYSTDGTREIIKKYQEKYLNIRLIDNPGRIVSTGMNLALRQARGSIVIRVDGHCIISPDYVRKCVDHIREGGVDGVGGSMETVGETFIAKAIAIGMSSKFGVGGSAFRTIKGKRMMADTVPFPAYTREIIEKAGAYDEELVRNQDDEYNYRIRKLGGRLLLAEDVHSTYFSRSTLGGLWRQHYQYGYWKIRVLQKHPAQMSLRQFIPPLLVLMMLASIILLFIPPIRYLAVIIPAAYVLANLGASTLTTSRNGWSSLPVLPIIYLTIHFAYGAGFWVGLFRFYRRWGDKEGKTPPLRLQDS